MSRAIRWQEAGERGADYTTDFYHGYSTRSARQTWWVGKADIQKFTDWLESAKIRRADHTLTFSCVYKAALFLPFNEPAFSVGNVPNHLSYPFLTSR
jgi:hypothetical protein